MLCRSSKFVLQFNILCIIRDVIEPYSGQYTGQVVEGYTGDYTGQVTENYTGEYEGVLSLSKGDVVELDVLCQREGPDLALLGRLPRRRDAGNELAFGPFDFEQRVLQA